MWILKNSKDLLDNLKSRSFSQVSSTEGRERRVLEYNGHSEKIKCLRELDMAR
jgi:saccharopine dehydrogenase-like NADP-dependent oxidoreductase